ncbi:hypothetical protein ACT9SR_13525, partial [Enterococcus faecalis]|uniref:hypothetical protein n=1 Tax=Enterococcus faecalis TaxID=1351 RepID=UPI00403A6B0B
ANRRLRDVLTQMLEPDPDKRPQAIGPLLEGIRAPRTSVPSPASGQRRSTGVDWNRIAEEGARIGREIEEN